MMKTGYIPQVGHKFTADHQRNKELICVQETDYWIFAKDINGKRNDLIKHQHNFYPIL